MRLKYFQIQLNICEVIFLCSAETAELDLDGPGGKMFLRVLLNLVMHNYPALVSGALQLLFRHFSQRQEVLQAFKQVSFHIFHIQTPTRKLLYYKYLKYIILYHLIYIFILFIFAVFKIINYNLIVSFC